MLDLDQRLATHDIHGTDVYNDLRHLWQLDMLQAQPCSIYCLSRDAQSRLQHTLIWEIERESVCVCGWVSSMCIGYGLVVLLTLLETALELHARQVQEEIIAQQRKVQQIRIIVRVDGEHGVMLRWTWHCCWRGRKFMTTLVCIFSNLKMMMLLLVLLLVLLLQMLMF